MIQNTKGKDVDVFYVVPGVVWRKTYEADFNEDEKKEAYCYYLSQAACMAEYANMYAPYYRQISLPSWFTIGNSDKALDVVRDSIGKEDVFAALDYYFENFNNGKPFILASHEQGSAILRTVFDEYMKKDETHKNYFKRMIAAYTLGFSYPKAWMSEVGIKGATGADDTGVIIAYNTEGSSATKPSILVTSDDYVINPLTWSTGTGKAEKSQNKGSFEWIDQDELIYRISAGAADAQVNPNRASLICTTIDDYVIVDGDPYGDKSLKEYDWSAYYVNLKENAKTRIDAYLAAHK